MLSLRNGLSKGLLQSYNKNIANAPIMELNIIKAYEIGSVFNLDNESRHLAIVCDDNKKKTNYKAEIEDLVYGLYAYILNKTKDEIKSLNQADNKIVKYEWKSDKPAILEIDLTTLLNHNLEFFTKM